MLPQNTLVPYGYSVVTYEGKEIPTLLLGEGCTLIAPVSANDRGYQALVFSHRSTAPQTHLKTDNTVISLEDIQPQFQMVFTSKASIDVVIEMLTRARDNMEELKDD